MEYKERIVIVKDENGYYAYTPDLIGCAARAETFNQVLTKINLSIEQQDEQGTESESQRFHQQVEY